MAAYPEDWCVDQQSNGGGGGSSFTYSQKSSGQKLPDGTKTDVYYSVSRVDTWVAEHRMVGIKVWLSNSATGYSDSDPSYFCGATGGAYKKYIFEAGELLKSLKIYESVYKDRHYCGGIEFKTTSGYHYENVNPSGGSSETMDVGFGAWVGIFGNSGEAIDKLGFWMVQASQDIELSQVTYNNSPPPPQKTILDSQSFTNGSSEDATFTYEQKFTVSTTESWSLSVAEEQSTSVSFSLSAEVYSVSASSEVSASWTTSQEETNSLEYTTSTEQTVNIQVPVKAGATVTMTVFDYYGSYNLGYTGLVTAKLNDGLTYVYWDNGQSQGKSGSQVFYQLS